MSHDHDTLLTRQGRICSQSSLPAKKANDIFGQWEWHFITADELKDASKDLLFYHASEWSGVDLRVIHLQEEHEMTLL